MQICNMQFIMSHPVDAIFNAINDLLELSKCASCQYTLVKQWALHLSYLLRECTREAMKIPSWGPKWPTIENSGGQMYNQNLKSNLMQLPSSVLYNSTSPTSCASQPSKNSQESPNPRDASFYLTGSAPTPFAKTRTNSARAVFMNKSRKKEISAPIH